MRLSLICAIATLGRAVAAKPITQHVPRAVETPSQEWEVPDIHAPVIPVVPAPQGQSAVPAFSDQKLDELYERVFNRSQALAKQILSQPLDSLLDVVDSIDTTIDKDKIKAILELLSDGVESATQELSTEANGGGALWTPLTELECDTVIKGLNEPLRVQWELFKVISRNSILKGADILEVLGLLRELLVIAAPECRGTLAKIVEAECKDLREGYESLGKLLNSSSVHVRSDEAGDLPWCKAE
ncbi:hypothetical protein B0T20DRAFT_397417 [Sordaria brevicollis]|uniref:Uncharacterized protein n=1 Tax=Sordaria brevicollis TaxID=83679 RepID=A0AAE0U3D8_SORBR|nr:hypothetical protein B0T20DRAFT_397417 [Sordaria brevicollis]